ncbi:MAG: PLDc_N domain-containing protein [Candidatus Hydrogenedentes bacterium]|nr:PLDc_N domain-containing protein [Candidatus Hydrogenedentota bacterium]
MMLLGLALIVGTTVFWVWMIVDCASNEPAEGNDRLVWILIIVLTHWLGALIYFFARRPARIQQYGR